MCLVVIVDSVWFNFGLTAGLADWKSILLRIRFSGTLADPPRLNSFLPPYVRISQGWNEFIDFVWKSGTCGIRR